MLVVVMAIVLILVAKNWQSVAPTAMQVADPELQRNVDDHGQAGAGQALRSGQLPDLNDVRVSTDAHADRLQEALEATE